MPTPTSVDEVTDVTALCATDRCDRCAAQAFVRVDLGGSTLDFCAHHFRPIEAALAEAGARVVADCRRQLVEKPTV